MAAAAMATDAAAAAAVAAAAVAATTFAIAAATGGGATAHEMGGEADDGREGRAVTGVQGRRLTAGAVVDDEARRKLQQVHCRRETAIAGGAAVVSGEGGRTGQVRGNVNGEADERPQRCVTKSPS